MYKILLNKYLTRISKLPSKKYFFKILIKLFNVIINPCAWLRNNTKRSLITLTSFLNDNILHSYSTTLLPGNEQ